MDFAPSPEAAELTERMRKFLHSDVLPAEPRYEAWRAEHPGGLAGSDVAGTGRGFEDATQAGRLAGNDRKRHAFRADRAQDPRARQPAYRR